ncbi:MAG TPA: MBL fold metallo-hydrolase [Candidatus Acidoferrum sp.]|nr:MBL fold metallo-hydrolase [Candidatus Acidoferrum sp.]
MSSKATVTDRGAIILGKNVACDAHNENTPLRVVTHAHADHMEGLQKSLRTCEKTLMTKATKDLIDVMRGPLFLMSGYVETLDYGKTIQYDEESITFFKADHILGAAQVLLEDAEGKRIAFTGDFRIDNTPILEADTLVMEATYGSPVCRRSFGVDLRDLLISLVEKGLKQDIVYIFGYHGKLQEVMQILHDAKINAPFIMSERVFHVSKVCEKHGMHLGRLLLSSENEARDLLAKNAPCIVFCHMNTAGTIGKDRFRIYVSGWEFDQPCREKSSKEYIIALSDHSDFEGLMEYVRRSKPSLVITDNFRVGHAETLAREIRKRFGIPATALPKR